jgi:N-formylglutamate amidohydrolase
VTGFDTHAQSVQQLTMAHMAAIMGDSVGEDGGRIPGGDGAPAFTLHGANPSSIPVLIAVPHAGRGYTEQLLHRMRNPGYAIKLEDRYADLLAAEVARHTGAMLLVAHAPRAMIDLNRAADDVDWEMIDGGDDRDVDTYTPGRRARSGLGLIPRRLPGLGELWKRRHEESELDQRIAGVHEPYHSRLGGALLALRRRWGAALVVDFHSMPPLGGRPGMPQPEFVLGDRFGATCDGKLIASAFGYFAQHGRRAAHNRPYAGGYVLERHAAPNRGIHALQLEIDRSAYLDSRLEVPGAEFEPVADLLAGLVRRLAAEVADLGQSDATASWPEAAE